MGLATLVFPPLAAQRLPFRNYTSDDGLAQSVVFALAQDRDGYLWLGTPTGLSRFDGLVFSNYRRADGLPASQIRSLLATADGVLWIGTDEGLSRFRDGRFDAPGTELGLPRASIRTLVDDGEGGVWVGTYGEGAFHVDHGAARRWTTREGLGHDRVRAATRGPDGRLWLGTYGGGISRIEPDGAVSRFGSEEGLGDLFVRALVFDAAGALLAATNGGLFRLAPGAAVFAPDLPSEPVARRALTALRFDPRGRLWIGTRDEGVCRWDGERLSCWRTPQGLAADDIDDLLLDHEGNVWIATFGGGVSRLSSEGFLNYTVSDGLPVPGVTAFSQDADGGLWMGTHGGGLARLRDGRIETRPTRGDLPHGKILSALDDRPGDLWFGTVAGAFELAGARPRRRLGRGDGLADEIVLDVARDGDDTLWLATQRGAVAFRADGSRFRLGAETLPAERVNVIVPARSGGVWIGTAGGLVRWADDRVLAGHGPADGLPDGYVLAILEAHDGTLWVGSGGGLSKLGPSGRFVTYSVADGLPHANTTAIVEDDRGRLWVGTTGGIAAFDGHAFSVFRSSDGLVSAEVNPHAAFRDRDGRIWFGTVKGAIAFEPSALAPAAVEPPIHLTRVAVGGEDVDLHGPLDLDYRRNDLRFEFVGISLAYPNDVTYEYQLDGLDARSRRTGSRFADYPALPPGRYTFSVRAEARGAAWSRTPATLAVTIRPPFWQTLWFRALATALVVASIVSTHRYRVHRLYQQRERLRQQVAEQTRELAAKNEALSAAYQALEDVSLTDPLTGLRNRRFLAQLLESDVALAIRDLDDPREPPTPGGTQALDMVFFLIDLDHFKRVNDAHGHGAGDQVLIQFTHLLRQIFREPDHLVRWGGEEFLVVARSCDRKQAGELAERIRDRVASHPFRVDDGQVLAKTCSIGFACLPFFERAPTAVSWQQVVDIADRCLYVAKRSGRNAWVGVVGSAAMPPDRFLERWSEDPRAAVDAGDVAVRSSIADPHRLWWN